MSNNTYINNYLFSLISLKIYMLSKMDNKHMLVNFGLQAHIKKFKMLVNFGLQAHTIMFIYE